MEVENRNEVGEPLAETYLAVHDGAFPPVEIGLINQWHQGINSTIIDRYQNPPQTTSF
jgi:hypothetical protein